MQDRDSTLPVLRVFPDYMADPVWNEEGAMVDTGHLPISNGLRIDLRTWRQEWEDLLGVAVSRYSIVDETAHQEWQARGRGLTKRLQDQLAGRATVIYEP
ncbi:hypothetical protein [Mobilicoccus caccae]|uniref:Uncharacterized protein n=1 Tax=Mobilicoccus caccae TaxID=1859295 RepID=A0ABQ6IW38_9MICO|nr:hypothetical protein [Mobilicoccus caccae]GMA41281.1 hypothetical protein GCM10025883_33260 [Mobilicoccus caccae]